MNLDEKKLASAGGVPAAEITKLGTLTFALPDSGVEVQMRKPMISDLLLTRKDKTVDQDIEEENLLCIISHVSTFNGAKENWSDIVKKFSIMDYNELATQYLKLTSPGKK